LQLRALDDHVGEVELVFRRGEEGVMEKGRVSELALRPSSAVEWSGVEREGSGKRRKQKKR